MAIPQACLHDLGFRHILNVRVLEGKGMLDTDFFTKMDPYVIVRFGQNVSRSEVHVGAGTECKFDWSVTFPFDPSLGSKGPSLEIVVNDQDYGPDTQVGRASVPFDRLARNDFRGWVPLTRKMLPLASTVKTGKIYLEYWLEKLSPQKSLPVPALCCIANHNTGGGLLRTMVDGSKFKIFQTWQMQFWMIDSIFGGKTCGWNKEYEAAKKIYGPGMHPMALRTMIRFEHSHLYSKDKRITGSYSAKSIRGSQDFLKMLPKFSSKTGKTIRFTYVILPNTEIHFSITSRKIVQDMLSKHALHSRAQKNVVYAGEFFVDRKSTRFEKSQKPAIIIDNNSGTFAPTKERLHMLKTLLQVNLGTDVPIYALDRDDPFLKECYEVNNVE